MSCSLFDDRYLIVRVAGKNNMNVSVSRAGVYGRPCINARWLVFTACACLHAYIYLYSCTDELKNIQIFLTKYTFDDKLTVSTNTIFNTKLDRHKKLITHLTKTGS